MSSPSKAFTQALRSTACPVLERLNFEFDGSRTFRRFCQNRQIVQIINFQLGQRMLQGEFTVNLGVYVTGETSADPEGIPASKAHEYHCAPNRRARLGMLIPRKLQFLSGIPYLGLIFGPKDVWWKFGATREETEGSLREVLLLLDRYGYLWLDEATPQ